MRIVPRLLSPVAALVLLVAGCAPAAPAPTAVPAAAPTAAPKPTTPPVAAATTAPTAAAAAKPTSAPAANLTGTLKIDTISEIESPHPYFASQLVGISVRMNVFDTLVDRDFDGKIVPALAESWTVVDDTTIDFKI